MNSMKNKITNDSKMQKVLMRDKLKLSIKQGEEGKIIPYIFDEFTKFPK
jgi:hypothetical protein